MCATCGAETTLSPRSGARYPYTRYSTRLTPWASIFRPSGLEDEAWHCARCARPLGLKAAFRPVPGLGILKLAIPHDSRRGLVSFALRAWKTKHGIAHDVRDVWG